MSFGDAHFTTARDRGDCTWTDGVVFGCSTGTGKFNISVMTYLFKPWLRRAPLSLALLFGLTAGHTSAAARAAAVSSSSFGSGTMSLGAAASFITQEQRNLNDLIKRANSREGGVSNPGMNDAYELSVSFESRGEGSDWSFQLRPAYFMQSSKGSGAGGDFVYDLKGYSLFGSFRNYLLENDMIHLFVQFGVGAGLIDGSVEENNRNAPFRGQTQFAGQTLGATVGIGADLCSASNHCFTIEAMYRRLKYDRLIGKKSSGTFDSNQGSLTQYGPKQEIEIDGHDLALDQGGLIFQLGYAYRF